MRKLLLAAALVVPLLVVPFAQAQRPAPVREAIDCSLNGSDEPRVDQARQAQLRAMPAPPQARAEDYFTPAERALFADYRRSAYLINFQWLGLELLTLVVLGLWRARELGQWASRRARDKPFRAGFLLVAVMVFVPIITTLPMRILDYMNDRGAKLATNTWSGFAADTLKSIGFAFVTTAIVAIALVWIARKMPRRWPVAAAAAAAALTFLLVYLLPVVYEPAFNRFTPVGPKTHARVLDLAEREGVRVNDVLIADASKRTSTLNAYVSGIGSTKRVVVYDTLLDEPCGVFDLVIAHELAHEKHHDVLYGTYLSMLGAAVGVLLIWWLLSRAGVRNRMGVDGAADPRVVPFLIFFIAGTSFVTMPVVNAISRYVEARADKTAIETSENPDAAILTEVRIARRNLADLNPNPIVKFWFFDHPATLERIQFALDHEWRRARTTR